jgi:hypothetical protein
MAVVRVDNGHCCHQSGCFTACCPCVHLATWGSGDAAFEFVATGAAAVAVAGLTGGLASASVGLHRHTPVGWWSVHSHAAALCVCIAAPEADQHVLSSNQGQEHLPRGGAQGVVQFATAVNNRLCLGCQATPRHLAWCMYAVGPAECVASAAATTLYVRHLAVCPVAV